VLEPFTRDGECRSGRSPLGAGHERGLRPGTENVASIVGLGVACERAAHDLDVEGTRARALRDELWGRVSGAAVLEGAPGVAASTGSACHEGREESDRTGHLMAGPRARATALVS